ncbi:MAG: hypothetical protein IJ478_07020 [Alistipes sp.]|nr:hypothetical protein [Alistipes sp.]
MKLRNLKRRLYGLTTLPERVSRVRYFRGHGVHSPFVYQLVRQAFMRREVVTCEPVLYEALRERGFPLKRAVQLQNLYTHCRYHSFSIDALDNPCDLCVVSEKSNGETTRELVERAARRHTTVVLLSPYEGRNRAAMCREIVENHGCTSVDKRAFLVLFSDPKLPKQHYRI